ncbi:hypothetical protein ACSFBI_03580 [Variovorax sp. RB3P1]|uniref:hypothetical protein n=1 Tax=Variovorax sp. RB3P1 TaxID=3443732 RepID=UPI003F4813C1
MDQSELFFPRPAPAPQPVAVHQLETDDKPLRFEDEGPVHRVPYRVRLMDYPAVDDAKVAEQRFRRELDRQLGTDVLAALRAYQNASESGESDLTKEEISMAKRWAKAYDAARTAGFRDLGDVQEAYFDVRPV